MNKKMLSITVWEGQFELIRKAAEAAQVSVSEYIRSRCVTAASATLGIELPAFPPFELPHVRRSEISKAAEVLGMTAEDFKLKIARQAAKQVLAEVSSQSGERAAVAPMPRFAYHG